MTSTLFFALTLCILAGYALSFRHHPNHNPVRCGPNEIRVQCIDRCQKCEYRYGGCVQPQVCTAGCNCIKGYYRNKQGKCIPEASCDASPPSRCRPNEEYRVCTCEKNCCNRNNPEACAKECLTGCFCRTGLVRDNKGNCIRPENCPPSEPPTKCKKDEKYYSHKPDCKNTCENYDNPAVLCLIGKPGCFCKEGLVKRKDGKCVRPKDCFPIPPICGVNEEHLKCGSACPPTCDDRNPEICTDQCVIGCFCKNGFIRETKGGRCIPESQCPPENCGPNEVYSDCVNPCNDCQSRNVTCNFLVCNKGCDCRPGYTRNDQRICIPESQCPPDSNSCGPNSHWTNCASRCPPTCSNPDRICIKSCRAGCECDPGFILDDFGNCIPKDQCPNNIVCGPNSTPSDCVSFCEPTCRNRNPEREFCPQACRKGCACDPGFLKDDDGNCIPEYECPAVCGPNSTPSDCVFCEPTCRNPKPQVCPQVCGRGCACNPGFIKDDKGNCIPQDQCPAVCGPNSTPSDCVFCEPTCSNPKPTACAESCGKGCACDPGFLKDDNGNCIPQDQCPVTCGPNSTPSDCASLCPRTCNSDREPKACPALCVKGCICNSGFVDDGNGNCIPEDECPPNNGVCTKIGEEYKTCGSPCEATCVSIRTRNLIKCPKNCKPGCFCKDGLVRDLVTGNCVKASECPNNGFCPKPGEIYKSCGSPCEATCANLRFHILIKCPNKCKPGCFCRDGLVRDSNNNCVEPDQCQNKTCGPNEEYSDCANPCNNCALKRNCRFLVCNKGCDCISGYTRYQGICIPESLCPTNPQCSIPKCGPGCQIDYSSKPCPCCKCEGPATTGGSCGLIVNGPGSVNCTTTSDGTQCDIVCDGRYQGRFYCRPGQGWTPALPTCAQSTSNSPQCSMPKCGAGCRIDYNSKPCPSCKCEETGITGGNCGLIVTGPGSVNCTTTQDGTQCNIICDGIYEGRFYCYPGQGWTPSLPSCAKSTNNNPQCSIPKCGAGCRIDYNSKPCPSCKCGETETAGGNCDLTVTGPGSVNCTTNEDGTQCDIVCNGKYQGRFYCRPGRGWSPALPSCAKSNSPRCPIPRCRPGCQIDDNSKPCPRCKCEGPGTGPQCSIPKCRPGCQIDYSSKPCPSCKCEGPGAETCGTNEEYSDCVNPCNDCETRGNCQFLVCNKGCDCRKGYRRYLGICIQENLCPTNEVCQKPGEIYKSCGSPCEATCFNLRFHIYIKCPKKCKPGCFCEDGLVRDSNNNCVEPDQCPNNVCGVNEERLECGSACPATCDDRKPGVCTLQCVNGCFCKEGFIREKKGGRCIPESQCPSTGNDCNLTVTGSDSSFNCTTDQDGTRCDITCDGWYEGQFSCYPGQGWTPDLPSCADSNNPVCPIPFCPAGCRIGQVPNNPCPACICDQNNNSTCAKNEVHLKCGTACPPTCAKRSRPCTKQCVRGCFCKEGYIRENEGGKCIPQQKCLKGPICHLPLCRTGCRIVKDKNQPCPKCVCDKNTTGPICNIPACKVGCQIVQDPNGRCAKCVCDKNTTAIGYCDLVVISPGSYNCISDRNGTRCLIFCDGTYEGLFTCYPGRRWTPDLPRCVKPKRSVCKIPDCKVGCQIIQDPNTGCGKCVCDKTTTTAGGNCDLIITGTGSFICFSSGNGTQCDIICDGRYEGRFSCHPGRGWTRQLPRCVKPKSPICFLPLCTNGCHFIKDPNQPCPRCVCEKNTTGPICHLPLCRTGCQIVKDPNQPCPKCVCDKNTTGPVCSIPNCKVGCQIVQDPNGRCAKCVCDKNTTAVGYCDLVVISPGSYNCISDTDGTRCLIFCDGTYEGQFTCYPGRGWRPALLRCVKPKRSVCEIPVCKVGCRIIQDSKSGCGKCVCDKTTTAGGDCDLIITGTGSYNCFSNRNGTQCDIICDGSYEGRFYCYPGRGWTSALPQCVKPKRPACSIPACKVGCQIVQNPYEGCAKCVCGKNTTAGGDCDLVVTSPGSFNCLTGYNGTQCYIFCVGKYEGQFSCYPGRGWTPALPRCVKPKRPVICNIPLCKPECQIIKDPNEPCPKCVCDKNTTTGGVCDLTVTGWDSSFNCTAGKDGKQCSIYCYGRYEGEFICSISVGRKWKPDLPSCANSNKKICPQIRCSSECPLNQNAKPCPRCECKKPPKDTCGKNEEYLDCGSACPPTCSNRNPICTYQCVKGCFCKEGFIRKCKNGACIPESKCPSKDNGYPGDYEYEKDEEESYEYEKDDEESYEYEKDEEESNEYEKDEEESYEYEKDEEEEYDYDFTEEYGETYEKECGKNEVIVKCAKPKSCNTCLIKGNCKLKTCSKGCDCKKGFYRNDDGVCIPQSQCPNHPCPLIKCPAYCAVVKDANSCPRCECEKPPTDTCRPDEQEYECKPFCTNRCNPIKNCAKICIKGCFCKEGLVLNDDGKCVKKDQCNQKPPDGEKCKKNEKYYPCRPTCNNTCENYGKDGPCPFICIKGCFCKEGLVLRKDGKCVKPEKCKKDTCGPDEQYYKCKPYCANRCNPITKCPKLCIKGCFCKKGLVLNDDGKCVRKDECNEKPPEKCKKDEQYYSCKPTCNNTCENYGKHLGCPLYCTSGCFCKKGLVLRKDGKCVKPDECEEDTCGPDEQYYKCKPYCVNRCNPPKFCPRICIKGCFCKKGLVLNDDDKCVKKSQCNEKPPDGEECKKNEQYYSCKPTCNNTCENYGRKGPCPLYCAKGCFCKEGLVLRKDGHCVKPEKCKKDKPCPQIRCTPDCPLNEKAKPCPKCECKKPPTDECEKNEVLLECGSACPPICGQKDPKFCTMQCVKGCFCKKGFIREKKGGRCIPESHCSSKTCGKNEERSKCGTACPATCANRDPVCTKQCVAGCFCKEGFIREEEGGKCISESHCPKDTCGKNEKHSKCGTACPATCANRDPVCTKQCKRGCFCKEGFIREEEGGKCIPESHCLKECPLINCLQGCDLDREHKPCPRCVCPDVPVCPRIACPAYCHYDTSGPCPKCKCDNTGKNINGYSSVEVEESEENQEKYEEESYEEKDTETYDENEEEENEENEEEENKENKEESYEESEDEYNLEEESDFYSEDDFEEEDITETSTSDNCKENEEPNECGTACPPTCSDRNRICTRQCVKGCFCKEGYIRIEEGGKCIPNSHCPKETCGRHEVYSQCVNPCNNCQSRNVTCNFLVCNKGCDCKPGYTRDHKGKCIPEKHCPTGDSSKTDS